MFNIGGSEMVVLAILGLLIFGPEGLPGVIRNVMRTVRAVRSAASDFQHEVKGALDLEVKEAEKKKRLATASTKVQSKALEPEPEPEPATATEANDEPPEGPADQEATSSTESTLESSPESDAAISQTDAVETPLSPDDVTTESSKEEDDDGPGLPMTHKSKTLPPVPAPPEKEDPS